MAQFKKKKKKKNICKTEFNPETFRQQCYFFTHLLLVFIKYFSFNGL